MSFRCTFKWFTLALQGHATLHFLFIFYKLAWMNVYLRGGGGESTYPRGVHTRKKRSSAIAIRHKTETRVNVMTTQLRNRQPWTEVSARPSTATADGMATQPTKKSATAKETIRHKVGCLRVLGDQRAKMTNMLPRQQKTAVSTSKVV